MESDSAQVRRLLLHFFPDFHDQIIAYEAEELSSDVALGIPLEEAGFVGVNDWLFQIVVCEVLPRISAAREDSADLARRFGLFMEESLSLGIDHVRNEISLEIGEFLLGSPDVWLRVRRFAGPLLWQELRELSSNFPNVDLES